ncbi:MAG: glycoside hydrolase family 3 N-terminal domain-containing protein [Thermomicrobiales bacterium]
MTPVTRRAVLGSLALAVTMPGAPRGASAQVAAEAVVAGMSLRQQVARMFMFPISGPVLLPEEARWLETLQPGGVILVQQNFGTAAEVQALTAALHATNPVLPPLVALDQEGGIVSRLADDPAPDATVLGTLPLAQISELAGQRAALLAAYGFDVNFAPVADVAFSPDSFMAGRTFGADPQQVADCVVAYLEGVAASGVLHCVKHFPGHGRVTVDSHSALPVLEVDAETWLAQEAVPFAAAVAAGVPMVMLGHLAVPMWDDLPASLSPLAVQALREDLGFAGVIVTDDLFMGALDAWAPLEIVDLALEAGVDLLLYVGVPDTPLALVNHVVNRVLQGEVPEDRITASAQRIVTAQLAR